MRGGIDMGEKKRLLKYCAKMVVYWIGFLAFFAGVMLVFSAMEGAKFLVSEEGFLYVFSFAFPLYLYMAAVVGVLIMGPLFYKVYYPVYVSMGMTRKCACIFHAAVPFAVAGILFLVAVGIWRITGENLGPEKNLSVLFAILIAAAGIGILFGGLMLRFGTVVAVLVAIGVFGVGIAGGVFVALSVTGNFQIMLKLRNVWFAFLKEIPLGVLALAGGVIFYLLCGFLVWKMVRKLEVRL